MLRVRSNARRRCVPWEAVLRVGCEKHTRARAAQQRERKLRRTHCGRSDMRRKAQEGDLGARAKAREGRRRREKAAGKDVRPRCKSFSEAVAADREDALAVRVADRRLARTCGSSLEKVSGV
eukprot:6201591-Pleurochrysis_carterae.AAC.1